MTKDQIFKLRLDETDRARLDAVAKHHEMTAAQVVRLLVKWEQDRIVSLGEAGPGEARALKAQRTERRRR